MPDRIIHNWHFNPVVQIDEKVLLLTQRKPIPAKVTWIEPIPWLEIDFGAVSAGGESSEREMKELYVNANEFAQYRFAPLTDNIIVSEHKAPKGTPLYGTKHSTGVVSYISRMNSFDCVKRLQLTEFFQFEDTTRYMKVKNVGTSDVTSSIVVFFGYIFQFEKLDKIEKPYTVIPCIARPTTRE